MWRTNVISLERDIPLDIVSYWSEYAVRTFNSVRMTDDGRR